MSRSFIEVRCTGGCTRPHNNPGSVRTNSDTDLHNYSSKILSVISIVFLLIMVIDILCEKTMAPQLNQSRS